MNIKENIHLDFCDVLIEPKISNLTSRTEVELTRNFSFLHSKEPWNGVPIIISNMDSTGSMQMAKALKPLNIWVALHKFYSATQLIDFFSTADSSKCFYSLGTREEDFEKLKYVVNHLKPTDSPKALCLDVANGYTKDFFQKAISLREKYPKAIIMAGNVATPEAVSNLLLNCGVDIVKIGIGPSKICETRKVAGVGVPQLSALIACAEVAHGLNGHICGDGGIAEISDFGKGFCANADFLMTGSFFAGCDECEGEWVGSGVDKCFKFYGMASADAMEKHYGEISEYRTPEGRTIYVKYKGSATKIAKEILGGLRSTGTLIGANKLKYFSRCATFVKVNRTVECYKG